MMIFGRKKYQNLLTKYCNDERSLNKPFFQHHKKIEESIKSGVTIGFAIGIIFSVAIAGFFFAFPPLVTTFCVGGPIITGVIFGSTITATSIAATSSISLALEEKKWQEKIKQQESDKARVK